jgi:Kinesin motor domain
LLTSGRGGYLFDGVYGPGDTNHVVYVKAVEREIGRALQGINMCVLIYGVTGSGKTHTAFGDLANRGDMVAETGLVGYCVKRLANEHGLKLSASYVEVYNETIKDLLGNDDNLVISDTANGEVAIPAVKIRTIESERDLTRLIREGNLRRKTAKTGANIFSSRSHAVLQLYLRKSTGENAKITFIDLAGSERVASTGNQGIRLNEGSHINKSLLALGRVITQLAEGGHVSYRDSKLTRLLKDSLGGNTRTILIVCLSPVLCHLDETLQSLQYGTRARGIKQTFVANIEPTPSQSNYSDPELIACQMAEISKLRGEVGRLREMLRAERIQRENIQDKYIDLVQTVTEGQLSQRTDYQASPISEELRGTTPDDFSIHLSANRKPVTTRIPSYQAPQIRPHSRNPSKNPISRAVSPMNQMKNQRRGAESRKPTPRKPVEIVDIPRYDKIRPKSQLRDSKPSKFVGLIQQNHSPPRPASSQVPRSASLLQSSINSTTLDKYQNLSCGISSYLDNGSRQLLDNNKENITSSLITAPVNKLPQAREKIRDFRHRLGVALQQSSQTVVEELLAEAPKIEKYLTHEEQECIHRLRAKYNSGKKLRKSSDSRYSSSQRPLVQVNMNQIEVDTKPTIFDAQVQDVGSGLDRKPTNESYSSLQVHHTNPNKQLGLVQTQAPSEKGFVSANHHVPSVLSSQESNRVEQMLQKIQRMLG